MKNIRKYCARCGARKDLKYLVPSFKKAGVFVCLNFEKCGKHSPNYGK